MKTLLALLLSIASVAASEINLIFDASPDPRTTGYVLYASTNFFTTANFKTNSQVVLNLGTNTTVKVTDLRPATWSFTVTAIAPGLESDPSNILLVTVPTPPANLRTVAVQYGMTVTNFTDVGFFKIRIGQ